MHLQFAVGYPEGPCGESGMYVPIAVSMPPALCFRIASPAYRYMAPTLHDTSYSISSQELDIIHLLFFIVGGMTRVALGIVLIDLVALSLARILSSSLNTHPQSSTPAI